MTGSDSPSTHGGGDSRTPPRDAGGAPERIGTLRGASVQSDPRRLARMALGLVMATLAVLAVVFLVAGIHSNDQIDRLHNHGQPVTVTVTGCLGLLGGSGSNAAGDSCSGTYTLSGHTFTEPLPGSTFYKPGTRIPALAVPGDPALVSPTTVADAQHSTAGVFVLPAVLGGVFLVLAGIVAWRHRAGRQNEAASD